MFSFSFGSIGRLTLTTMSKKNRGFVTFCRWTDFFSTLTETLSPHFWEIEENRFFLFWFEGEKQSHVRSWCHKPIWEQFVNDLRGFFCRWVMEPRSRYGHCLGSDIPNKPFSYTQNFLLHRAFFKYNLTVFYFKHTLLFSKNGLAAVDTKKNITAVMSY